MKTVRISMKKNTILEEMFFGLFKASAIAINIKNDDNDHIYGLNKYKLTEPSLTINWTS
jgi:hypothetical protein